MSETEDKAEDKAEETPQGTASSESEPKDQGKEDATGDSDDLTGHSGADTKPETSEGATGEGDGDGGVESREEEEGATGEDTKQGNGDVEGAGDSNEATIKEKVEEEAPQQEGETTKEEEAPEVSAEQSATEDTEQKQPDSNQNQGDENATDKEVAEGKEEGVAKMDTELETEKQEPEGETDGGALPEDQEPLTDEEGLISRPISGGTESQGEVVTIDGIPVLEDIVEEAEEEEEEVEESREELIEKILMATEERSRLDSLNTQIQSDIAEYLARKKDDEKADPGRTVIDHEKKYFQCMTILEGLHDEMDILENRNTLEDNEMITLRDKKLEELAEAKAEFLKYRKEKVLNVVDPRTGRKMTAKDLEDYQTAEDKKERDIVQVRLEGIKLQNKITKLESMIKQKEQLVGGLHLIDFEQLKINNVDLNEKIEERNDEILKLKKKVTSTVEVLTHVKEKLQFLQAENAQKKEELREIESVVAKKRDHLTRIKRTRDALRSDNLRLRQKGGLVGHTALLRDFEEKQDQSEEMYKKLETLQKRQAELSVMCEGLKKKIEQAKYVSNQ